MGAATFSCKFNSPFISLPFLIVLIEGHALQRLIKHTPVGFETNFRNHFFSAGPLRFRLFLRFLRFFLFGCRLLVAVFLVAVFLVAVFLVAVLFAPAFLVAAVFSEAAFFFFTLEASSDWGDFFLDVVTLRAIFCYPIDFYF